MRLAIVTGGTKGIGKAIVEDLLHNGYRVYFTYLSSELDANQIVQSAPNRCKGFKVDSNHIDQIQEFSEKVLDEATPYALINNVGINQDALFMNHNLEQFWNIFNTNFGSVIHFSKMFINKMVEQREGHIINISSVAANKPKIGNSTYGTSKIAIERFSKSLALEVARFNIHVNCIAPSFVNTGMFDRFIQNQDKRQFFSQIPMKKILLPKEVSKLVVGLCNKTIVTTGTIFNIGNGDNIY